MSAKGRPATTLPRPGGLTTRFPEGGYWLLFVLFLVPLIGYVHRLIINILIDPISLELGISDTQASFLQGPPFAVAYALMVIPMGLLADRGNRLLLLSIGALIWSLGTLLCGAATGYGMLFAARLIVGVGEAALTPAIVSYIGDSFGGGRRGLAMGIFFMGINAGFSSAYAIGGITLEAAEAGFFQVVPVLGEIAPWRQVFVVLSIPGFLIPLLLLTLREPPRQEDPERDGTVSTLALLFRRSTFTVLLLLLVLVVSLLAVADNGIYAWLPRLLTRMYMLSPSETGIALGIIVAIGGLVGGPIGGNLSDYFTRRYGAAGPLLVVLLGTVIAACVTPLYAVGSVWLVYAATGLWVVALVSITASAYTFIAIAAPPQLRGVASSAVVSVSSLIGLGLGPTVIAVTLEQLALSRERVDLAIIAAALPLCAVALVLAIATWRIIRRSPLALVPAPGETRSETVE
ncbi:MAG: MFS transporter [Haliea sp.]|uniref:MFS transporter n=1 Tax=Haliea sp. TaxID=1932666 RepID=UPI0032EAE993